MRADQKKPYAESDGLLRVISAAPYRALQDALAKNTFERSPDSQWPTARLDAGRARGHAQLMPALLDQPIFLTPEQHDALLQTMWEQRKTICDLDTDVLDALSSLWIQKSKGPDASAIAEIDELLLLRGLKRKLGGHGRRGGFTEKQRAVILAALSHLHNVWMTIELDVFQRTRSRAKRKREMVQSRPFVITDTLGQLRFDGYIDVHRFIFHPGSIFGACLWGPMRQVALLSAKALHYNPYRQKWEKRLARYISWQWRIRARAQNYEQPYRVGTLLEALGGKLDSRHPIRTRARFERALDTLAHDGVIAQWRYKEPTSSGFGWTNDWPGCSVMVEPPAEIRGTYKGLIA